MINAAETQTYTLNYNGVDYVYNMSEIDDDDRITRFYSVTNTETNEQHALDFSSFDEPTEFAVALMIVCNFPNRKTLNLTGPVTQIDLQAHASLAEMIIASSNVHKKS